MQPTQRTARTRVRSDAVVRRTTREGGSAGTVTGCEAQLICSAQWGGGGTRRQLSRIRARKKYRSEAPRRLARSCCPSRAFRHLLHRNTSARTLPPPLYTLSRGTAPAAAKIECSLAIGVPAEGGGGTLLLGTRRERGCQDQGGEPSSRFLHRRPGAAATARSWWSFPRNSIQVVAAARRCGAHLLCGRRRERTRIEDSGNRVLFLGDASMKVNLFWPLSMQTGQIEVI